MLWVLSVPDKFFTLYRVECYLLSGVIFDSSRQSMYTLLFIVQKNFIVL